MLVIDYSYHMVPVKLYIEYASTYLKKEGKYHKNTPKKIKQTNKQQQRQKKKKSKIQKRTFVS
jgi:hypothetical protein